MRDSPLGGDAEEFLRRLEDKSQPQNSAPPPHPRMAMTNLNPSPYQPPRHLCHTSSGVNSCDPAPSHLYLTSGANNCDQASSYLHQTTRGVNKEQAPGHMYQTLSGTNSSDQTSGQVYYCCSCPYSATTVRELVTHRQVVHREGDPNSRFLPPPLLPPQQLHRPNIPTRVLSQEEREQKIYKCPYCDTQVKGRKAIENHVLNQHIVNEEGPDRLYWCSFCTLKCRSAPGLASHLKRHKYQGDC
ncbi:hypothetical protein Pmani_027478 [Petrolisthes manimaculis]|uniref:C2H2-type domain-containing protein n=1 Tax=Petrolisthes manimaculis TaxID=1843537 RepID=A0AAE1TWG6_9EUCA|nr:hypothetical protein Pmani_027478 [Petrolisthes manimaculis]